METSESIKQILLTGGVVYFSFKEDKEEYIGEAKVHICNYAFGSDKSPKIISEIPTVKLAPGGRKEYELSDIDKAVTEYCQLVFSTNNFMYKHFDAVLELKLQNRNIDHEYDYEEIRELQLKKQNE